MTWRNGAADWDLVRRALEQPTILSAEDLHREADRAPRAMLVPALYLDPRSGKPRLAEHHQAVIDAAGGGVFQFVGAGYRLSLFAETLGTLAQQLRDVPLHGSVAFGEGKITQAPGANMSLVIVFGAEEATCEYQATNVSGFLCTAAIVRDSYDSSFALRWEPAVVESKLGIIVPSRIQLPAARVVHSHAARPLDGLRQYVESAREVVELVAEEICQADTVRYHPSSVPAILRHLGFSAHEANGIQRSIDEHGPKAWLRGEDPLTGWDIARCGASWIADRIKRTGRGDALRRKLLPLMGPKPIPLASHDR